DRLAASRHDTKRSAADAFAASACAWARRYAFQPAAGSRTGSDGVVAALRVVAEPPHPAASNTRPAAKTAVKGARVPTEAPVPVLRRPASRRRPFPIRPAPA